MLCRNCGLLFDSPLIGNLGSGVLQVSASGNIVSCPRCGAMARQRLQGDFEISPGGRWRHLASALASKEATSEDLQNLLDVLRLAQASGANKSEIVRDVKDRVPRLAAVGEFINSSAGDRLGLWLTVILTVIGLVLANRETDSEPAPPPSITVVVQQPDEKQIEEWIKKAVKEAKEAERRPKKAPPER